MTETLKFSPDLVPLVLSGEKTTTWRLWDDKNLQEGDKVVLIARPELKPFAEARVVSVVEKLMGQLAEEDKKGHESFESDEEMFKTYSDYYRRPVDANTPVKIIRLKLTKTR